MGKPLIDPRTLDFVRNVLKPGTDENVIMSVAAKVEKAVRLPPARDMEAGK